MYPFRRQMAIIKNRNFSKFVLTLDNAEAKFTEIFKKNYWGNVESISGAGSTLEFTENLRCKLPELFEKLSIKTIFDAPCGDFNWMMHVIKANNINYIGADIVIPLIKSNIIKYKNNKTNFIHIDLTRGKFPKSDLMICRDCLFHLSFHDTKLVLQNFIDSKIPYLPTTTHINKDNFKNIDIVTGDFRMMDLFAAPHNLPKDINFRIEDWKAPDPEKEMCLWTREQIIESLDITY